MIFQSFGQTKKKLLLLFLLLLLSWWVYSAPVTYAAGSEPKMYTITEQELTTLENNLATLSAINQKLQMESKTQNTQVTQLQEQLKLLQSQLATLRQESEKQQALLTAANRSLEEYATEAKRTRLRIKAQRNFWEAAAACLLVGLIVK